MPRDLLADETQTAPSGVMSEAEFNKKAPGTLKEVPYTPTMPSAKPAPVDTSYGMSNLQLGLAGAGGELNDLLQGLKEKGQLAFSPEGAAGEALRAKIGQERADRAAMLAQLYQNPAAIAGQLGAKVIPAIAAPARIPAQALLEGATEFAKPGSDQATGALGELMGSLKHGGVGALSTAALGKIADLAGKGYNALRGNLTPQGVRAMETNAAAERLGIPNVTVGQLDPSSAVGQLEQSFPGYLPRLTKQASALGDVVSSKLALPEGDIVRKGAAFEDELRKAAQNRLALGGGKYDDVDKFIQENGLRGVQPKATADIAANPNVPGYQTGANLLREFGTSLEGSPEMGADVIGSAELAMRKMHDMRVSANAAWVNLKRAVKREPQNAELQAGKKFIEDFKNAVDSDISEWGAKNKSNAQGAKLYEGANDYWKNVVAPTVKNNPLATKVLSWEKGFKEPVQSIPAATSIAGSESANLLRPTMSQRGVDMLDVLRNLPDVKATMLTGQTPAGAGQGGLGALSNLARVGAVHPLALAEAVLPGATATQAAKNLHFAPGAFADNAPLTFRGMQNAALKARAEAQKEGGLGMLRQAAQAGREALPARSIMGALRYPNQDIEQRARRLTGG